MVADDIKAALGMGVDIMLVPPEKKLAGARALAEKKLSHFLRTCSSLAGSISAQRRRPQLCIASSLALTSLSVPDLSYQHSALLLLICWLPRAACIIWMYATFNLVGH